MLGAAAVAITPAVGTDPVKESRLMSGCAVSGAPACAARPLHDVEDARRQPRLVP